MQISAKAYFDKNTQANKPITGKTIEASEDTKAIFKYLQELRDCLICQ
jgi:hypothetical protein